MSDGLRQLWGLDAPASPAGGSQQAQQFHQAFIEKIEPANRALQSAAALARQSEFATLDTTRAQLYSAYQSTLRRIDPADPSKAQRDINRVLAAADTFRSRAEALGDQTTSQNEAWHQREAEYDQLVDHVTELEDAQHPKAPVMRRLVDAIGTQSHDHDYGQSVRTLDQVSPKVEGIYQQHAESARATEGAQAEQVAPGDPAAQRAPTTASRPEEAEPVDMQESYVSGASVVSSARARTSASSQPSDEQSELASRPQAESAEVPQAATAAEEKPPLSQRSAEERAAVETSPDDTVEQSEGTPPHETRRTEEGRSTTPAEEKPPLEQRSPEERAAAQADSDDTQDEGTAAPAQGTTQREPAPTASSEPTQTAETGAVGFTVRDRATDQPIEGATVRLGDSADGRGVTGRDGTCVIQLPAGNYSCRVASAEHHEYNDMVEVGAGFTSPLFVRLERAASVEQTQPGETSPAQGTPQREPAPTASSEPTQTAETGAVGFTVRDRATEQPIEGATVRLGDSADGRGVTGRDGTCLIQLPAGNYSCHVASAEYHEYNDMVEVGAGSTSPLFVRLERSASVEQTQPAEAPAPAQGVPQREPPPAATPEAAQSSEPTGRRLTQEERDEMHTDMNSIEEELERIGSERNLSWSR